MSTYSAGSRGSYGGGRRSRNTPESTGRYSDDFDSEDDRRDSTPLRRNGYNHDRLRGRGRGLPLRGRGRGQRGRGSIRGRGHSRNSEPADMRSRGVDNTATRRVMSASRNKINELRNRVEEMKLKLRDLEQENRLYKKLQLRQEKAIRSFEDKENDLPNILDKHNNEVRSLKEQNRRLREKHDKTDRYLRDAEDELERVKRKMLKYKKICDEKELPEREELAKKVTKAELDMEERDVRIKELQRHVESLKKNHRHELGIEAARQRELKKQLEEALEKNTTLETTVKAKEKALDYSNIYSNPARNRSTTRDNSPNDSPGRGRTSTRSKNKSSSLTDLTPRDKAKFYAEKKRAELLKQKEIKAEQEKKKRQKWEEEEREREAREREEREAKEEREREERERERREKEEAAALARSPPHFNFRSIDRGLEEKEEQERRKREEENRLRREREDREAKEELERKRMELERRRNQEQTDRRDREEREKKEREERERREREERERKEKEERERREREREEQARRIRLEKERLDNDPALIEERRKKDELLRKLQAMDALGSAGTPGSDAPASNSGSSSTSRRGSKFGGGGDGFDSVSKKSDPKEYSFTKPTNNLHLGKPSHEDVHVPYIDRQRQQPQGRKPMTLNASSSGAQDDGFGYQPSFGPPGGGRLASKVTNSKPLSIFDDDDDVGAFKVKSDSPPKAAGGGGNLLENLFGPQAAKSSSTRRAEDNKTFFVTGQASPSPVQDPGPAKARGNMNNGNATTFPWDANTTKAGRPTANKSAFDTDNSSTLFGGGAALVDDSFSPSNGKILPRRRQQANLGTFSSKPSVIAMDNFDDDMEEVVL